MLGSQKVIGQVISFTYDTGGNRIKRLLSSPPPAEKMINLTAEGLDVAASLNWYMTNYLTSNILEVQRSSDKEKWVSLAFLESAEDQTNFSFVDYQPLTGENYYRIKVVSSDEQIVYSSSRIVYFESPMSIYPNPVRERLNIKTTAHTKMEVINRDGRTIFTSDHIPADGIDVSQFLPGIYILRLYPMSGPTMTSKFFKEK
jgi:hypothetical protein